MAQIDPELNGVEEEIEGRQQENDAQVLNGRWRCQKDASWVEQADGTGRIGNIISKDGYEFLNLLGIEAKVALVIHDITGSGSVLARRPSIPGTASYARLCDPNTAFHHCRLFLNATSVTHFPHYRHQMQAPRTRYEQSTTRNLQTKRRTTYLFRTAIDGSQNQTFAAMANPKFAEENDGEPVDDLALMRRAYTNKKTGQIDDGLVRDVVDLVQTQVVDEVSQLQTEDDASTASTNLSRFRINEIVESSVPKKKGRLVGLGRRTRSVPPSSAPPPFVDPEVLTAQLKDKDDRISLLETQMAAQQAGYEAQRRLN
ncbi:hypothetical protein DY000_02059071 [Brassica cretica]|uniref:Uncharacterized protein n=1 Tax=Brassica cretica TaxID=69181 RepID=A0ABQ7ANS0_BRACR|nr:hypothetical protein DY000_02059071 [Brassica cretica]